MVTIFPLSRIDKGAPPLLIGCFGVQSVESAHGVKRAFSPQSALSAINAVPALSALCALNAVLIYIEL